MDWRVRLCALVGWDPRIVRMLPGDGLTRLAGIGALWLVPVLLVGVSSGVAMWMVLRSAALAGIVGLGFTLFVLNLVRLVTSGGGVAPHEPPEAIKAWKPRALPLSIFLFLGSFFGQPAALLVMSSSLDAAIDRYRIDLTGMHEAAVLEPLQSQRDEHHALVEDLRRRTRDAEQKLADARRGIAALKGKRGDGRDVEVRMLEAAAVEHEATLARVGAELSHEELLEQLVDEDIENLRTGEVEDYARHLRGSYFVVRRVRLMWEQPVAAGLLTAVFCLLMLLPLIASRRRGLEALRSYETVRRVVSRNHAQEAYAAAMQELEMMLRAWKTYEGPSEERFEDPPFNTVPRRKTPKARVVKGDDIFAGLPRE